MTQRPETPPDLAEKHPALTVIEGGAKDTETVSAESLPEGMVNIYETLSAYEFPVPKNRYDQQPQPLTKAFYFEMLSDDPHAPAVYIKATKEALIEGGYSFWIYEGGANNCIASISSSGQRPLAERAPLKGYETGCIGTKISEKSFLARSGIARIVQRTRGGTEEVIYNFQKK